MRRIILVFLLSFVFGSSIAQQDSVTSKKKIQLINADRLKFEQINDISYRILAGNVRLRNDSITMECDSAVSSEQSNQIRAYGNVLIYQGDSFRVTADSLHYNGAEQKATLYSNVFLTDGSTQLSTDKLTYLIDRDLAYYLAGATITNSTTYIESKRGYYYNKTSQTEFRDSVYIKNNDYTVWSDTMHYNTKSEISRFYGKTLIKTGSSEIKCYNGWLSPKTDQSRFGRNTTIESGSQRLITDSLFFNNKRAYAHIFKRFNLTDKASKFVVIGDSAEYFEQEGVLWAYNYPLLKDASSTDTMYLRSRLLHYSEADSLSRFLKAYDQVRIYKSDLQGICDSLYYSIDDSLIQMFYQPIIWSEDNQSSADTIFIQMAEQKVKQTFYRKNAMLISEKYPEVFDQIKGKRIDGYFTNGEIAKMKIVGNAESIYFAENDSKALMGVNEAKCGSMNIRFRDSKVSKITFLEAPSATFSPMQAIEPQNKRLAGFVWQIQYRPSRIQILAKP